jgi:glycosyltransferase involved in cell wall biosynthesis
MAIWREVAISGHELHIFGSLAHSSPWLDSEPLEWAPINLIAPVRLRRSQTWWYLPKLGTGLQRLKPDIVHVWSEAWAVSTWQTLQEPFPVVAHGADNLFAFGNGMNRRLRLHRAKRNLKRMAGYASWNSAGAELARHHGLPSQRPTLVACPALWDPGSFEAASRSRSLHRQRLGFDDQVVVGFVGKIGEEKGVAWLLESFSHVSERRARLHFFGEGPQLGAIQTRAQELGVTATFSGVVPIKEIPGVMAALDVLVVPSVSMPDWNEQWGRVVAEAMLAGTPVIASSSGSLPEVVGPGGVVVPENDVGALSRAIEDWVSDEAARALAARRAREWARVKFDPKAEAARVLEFWREVLRNK